MKKINYLLYSFLFLVLNYPAKAFGMYDLYGATIPDEIDPWYIVAGRWLLFPVLPLAVLIAIIVIVIRKIKNKK